VCGNIGQLDDNAYMNAEYGSAIVKIPLGMPCRKVHATHEVCSIHQNLNAQI
jgi:hypothetical protein